MKSNEEQLEEMRTDLEQAADNRINLSIERTELALERTQLSWVRTLLSMIAGGFVIDKALEQLHKARIASGDAWLKNVHAAGLVISCAGTLLMIFVTILYVNRSKKLARMKGGTKSFIAPGFMVSVITILIGLLLIFLIGFSKNA